MMGIVLAAAENIPLRLNRLGLGAGIAAGPVAVQPLVKV